jgi:uncharacterized membrane protein YoaK (UPF0700 family)
MSTNAVATAERVDNGRDVAGDRKLRDWLLFALTVSSGVVDVISFLALGRVFTAFMTGNIVFLGMGIARDVSAPSIIAVLASMGGFGLGSYLATRIVRPEDSASVVWPFRTTCALAISLLPHLCFVVVWMKIGGRPGHGAAVALLSAWALAMGMQSAAVRRLNVGGIFTTAATATVLFLAGGFAQPVTGEERHRLFGVLASLLIGATAGALLHFHAPLYAPLFPFVITLTVVTVAAKAFGYCDDYSFR